MQLERGHCNGVCCKAVQLERGALQSGLQLEKGGWKAEGRAAKWGAVGKRALERAWGGFAKWGGTVRGVHGARGAQQGGGQLQSRVRTQKGKQRSRRALLQGRGLRGGEGCGAKWGAAQRVGQGNEGVLKARWSAAQGAVGLKRVHGGEA